MADQNGSEILSPRQLWELLDKRVTVIPDAMVRSKKLHAPAKLVYGTLVRYSSRKHFTYPKLETLAEACGVCENTVRAAIKELVREGYILEERRPRDTTRSRQTTNIYYFRAHPDVVASLLDDAVLVDKGGTVIRCAGEAQCDGNTSGDSEPLEVGILSAIGGDLEPC